MCQYMQYNLLNGKEYLYCSITENICLYSKYCRIKQKYIANERWEQCKIMNEKKSLPNGANEVVFEKKGYLYIVRGNYTIKVKNTLNKVPEYVYVREGIDGYEISEKPFEEKKTTTTRNRKEKTNI